jgi:hypothetical protein
VVLILTLAEPDQHQIASATKRGGHPDIIYYII